MHIFNILSNAALRFLGGIKSLLFLTREISGSSVPLKYSARRNFLVNSNISSFNSCWFPRSGVGVNFKPFFKYFLFRICQSFFLINS